MNEKEMIIAKLMKNWDITEERAEEIYEEDIETIMRKMEVDEYEAEETYQEYMTGQMDIWDERYMNIRIFSDDECSECYWAMDGDECWKCPDRP